MRLHILVFTCLFLFACGPAPEPAKNDVALDSLQSEEWRMVIELPGMELPVHLHLANDLSEAWFRNGVEKVKVPEISKTSNGLVLRFPAFNNTFVLQQEGDVMTGELTLVKLGYEQHMPVKAQRGEEHRFSKDAQADVNLTGRWETVFTDDKGEQTQAIGEFDQQGSRLVGTFLTPKGDYRYLEGEVRGRQLLLSTFDGAHAFAFSAELAEDGSLQGGFWSGTRSYETWIAQRNFDASLPDAFELTFLKEGYDRLEFSFPDLDGNPVTLDDPRFEGKVVLVTLSGTWCPNCADEVAFLTDYYRENRDRGLEIVTLLYEHFGEFELAAEQGKRLRDEFGVEYTVLVAGVSDKTLAAETLPMLNHVLAFPTMVFIDRNGTVRRIHTGFSGPGTGRHYSDFVEDFHAEMDVLLAEKTSTGSAD